MVERCMLLEMQLCIDKDTARDRDACADIYINLYIEDTGAETDGDMCT